MKSAKKSAARIAAMVMLITLLPAIVILANALFIAYSHDFYQNEVRALGSTERYAYAPELAREIADFYTMGMPLPADKLNEREIVHLEDVKKVLVFATFLLYVCIILYSALVFFLYKTASSFKSFITLFQRCLLGGSILLLVLLGLSFIIFTSFHEYFNSFHYLFFEEGTWNFPEDSNLIMTFPEQFFIDAALGIVINSFLAGLALAALSFMAIQK